MIDELFWIEDANFDLILRTHSAGFPVLRLPYTM